MSSYDKYKLLEDFWKKTGTEWNNKNIPFNKDNEDKFSNIIYNFVVDNQIPIDAFYMQDAAKGWDHFNFDTGLDWEAFLFNHRYADQFNLDTEAFRKAYKENPEKYTMPKRKV